jgi:signal transduction histidine kinase
MARAAQSQRVDIREIAPTADRGVLPWRQPLLWIALACALLLAWAVFVRANNDYPPLDWGRFRELGFDPWVVGFAAQEMLLPVALLFLFSRWPLFRQCITRNPETTGLRWRLFLVLAGGQILYALYQYGLIRATESSVTLGLIMAVAAGVLGGLPVGLGVGVVAMVTNALLAYFPWPGLEPVDWDTFLTWFMLFNLGALAALWAGIVAGLASPSLRLPPRFALRKLLFLGLGVDFFASFCLFVASDSDGWVVERLLPNLAVAALAVLALQLMVRDVLDDETRRDAEAAQLELAQANLALTQTKLALAQAELRALHAQINPHFLFNSLNTIRYFIRTDPSQARDLLTSLSELFQRALSAGEFVPLREEISHVEAYLSLEQARLDERLQVIWTNLARSALEAPVPTLILQPLVENAVIHGISPKPEGGVIHIVVNQVGVDLLIQVDDNGMGFDAHNWQTVPVQEPTPPAQANALVARDPRSLVSPGTTSGLALGRPSIGLRNVDERLRMLYGEQYHLHVESAPGNGTRVVIRIPLHNGARHTTRDESLARVPE